MVVLVGVEQCTQTLEMLFRHPQAARHVRKLIVRTGTRGSVVSSMIRKVAVRLDALNTFEWDGEEMPEEDIWFALRMLCVCC
jgi:radical SAM superfamily enzyme with C-terminal helix-hairpin-helix motif